MASSDLTVGGVHAVLSALERAPNSCLELWLKSGDNKSEFSSIEAAATTLGLKIQWAGATQLDKLYADTHHQGVVLRRRAPPLTSLKAWLDQVVLTAQPPLILVLDQVQDPRNFGACLRVADGAGVDAVVYPRDNSARFGNVLAKAASGAIDTLPLVAVANLAAALRDLKAAGIWLTGTTHDAAGSLYALDFRPPSGLVLGNEGTGLRQLTRSHCDQLAHIPMAGSVASLNVATAAAVCLFEARRQRLDDPAEDSG